MRSQVKRWAAGAAVMLAGVTLTGCVSASKDRDMAMIIRITPTSGDTVSALGAALDEVRQARRAGTLAGPVAVEFAGGTYAFTRGALLTAADSGTDAAPLVIRAAPGAAVHVTGGRTLARFQPVTDPAVLARLLPEARGAVLQTDLRAQGVVEFGTFHSRGFSRPVAPAMLELFHRDRPMPLACWPKEGFATIKGVPAEEKDAHGGKLGRLENGFFYDGDRPARWSNVGDILVHGYWAYDWANSYERIAVLDAKRHLIRLAPPAGSFGYRAGQRLQFLNILEELAAPGQWYVDRQAGILYFWPPSPLEPGAVTVSLLEAPFLTLDMAEHVRVENIVFEFARGSGLRVNGGRDCRIEGCTFRNLGNYGVVIAGGTGHAVAGCEMTGLGDGGVDVAGGDRRTLTPANHVVENNHIHHVGRWSKCYVPGVQGSGVGIRIAHNLIHDHPHCAILFSGNEFTIEYNEIHHVCLETGDVGAVYTGRDYTFRGNVVRGNFIHHTGGVGFGSMGVYNDDCVSGTVMTGNIFWKVPRAVFLGGGRDFRVENNIFVDCAPALALDGRGVSRAPVWHDMVYRTMKQRLEEMNWRQPPYSTRYPELAELAPFYARDDGIPPGNIRVARNVCVGGAWTDITWGATPDMVEFEANLVGGDPQFVNPTKGDFTLKKSSPAFRLGFQPTSMAEIGPQGKWRPAPE